MGNSTGLSRASRRRGAAAMLIAGALFGASIVGLAGLRVHDDRKARQLWARLA